MKKAIRLILIFIEMKKIQYAALYVFAQKKVSVEI